MGSSPTIMIGISFRDRDANRAKVTCYCAVGLSETDAWMLAAAISERMSALSDATLTKVELAWRYTVDSLGTPADSSDISRKILMLVTNDAGDINGLIIPSPSAAIWETTGPYAGIRLDLLSTGALAFAELLTLVDLRTAANDQFGTTLVTGGLAL